MLHRPDPALEELLEEQDGVELGVRAVRHCKSCWREDVHHPLVVSPYTLGFLIVATLGLILLLRPGRCVCCGKVRLF